MSDDFETYGVGLDSPAVSAEAIDYSGGDVVLAKTTRGVYVGGAGALVCTMADGSSATFTGLLAGMIYPLRITGVTASGSGATGLVGLS